jgi:hypothetical protein
MSRSDAPGCGMKTSNLQTVKYPGRLLFLLLFTLLACLFWRSFLADYVVFSNDGSFAIQKSEWIHLPESFIGSWYDLNTVGVTGGAIVPDFTSLFRWIFGAVGYAKFLAPVSLWFLGATAYFFFRRAGLSTAAAVLGGLAACLTTAFFSNVCWGSVPPIIAFGTDLLALGALIKQDKLSFWITPALAGFAVGVNVIEAADIGALFSLLVAAFALYQSIAESRTPFVAEFARGVGRTAIMASCAGFIAAYAVSILVGANIKGIVGTKQDEQTKLQHYDFATQWSLPKRETLGLVIPNLFGCNVITPGSASYWGAIGRDPSFDRYFASNGTGPLPPPRAFLRHTGRGVYIGIVIVLVAFWAVLQSFRKKDSAFTLIERKFVWFWAGAAIISLLLAWGRFAPFYQVVYHLPYFSTIRNPDKFLHIVTFATVILFGYGFHGLHRRYIEVPLLNIPQGRLKAWWARAGVFDRRCVIVLVGLVLLSLVGWGVYAAMRGRVEDYLVELQRVDALSNGKNLDAGALEGARDLAVSQISFSLRQIGWFILVLAASSGLLLFIISGAFAGRRARWAGIFLGIILVGDLARANLPYIVFWNYKEKYEIGHPEPLIEFLANKPYEHRVAYLLPMPLYTPETFANFKNLYDYEWTQQLFPVYSIPTLDIVQMPRTPEDLEAFNTSLRLGITEGENGRPILDQTTFFRIPRLWELTATRYLVGPAFFPNGNGYVPMIDFLNSQFDSTQRRFRIIQRFNLGNRPGVTQANQYSQLQAVPTDDPNALYALYEFAGAFPRAVLFSNWQVVSDNQAALTQLTNSSFDPAKTMLVTKPLPVPANPSANNQDFASVKITSYHPADIKLEATPTSPSVLMLCDKYDPDWQVWVDGRRSEVLRCNFLMRGVYLEPGQHEVEFRFRPNIKMFYVNVAATFIAICLLGYAAAVTRRRSIEA